MLSIAGNIAIEPKPLYYYYHRKNSITTVGFSKKSLDDLEAAQKNYEIIKRKSPEAIDVAEFRLDFSTLKIIDKIVLSESISIEERELLKNLIGNVKKHKKRIINSPYFTTKRKILFLLLMINNKAYCYLVKKNAKNSLAV